jgi:tetratricopeptide (TPR) repeat protein
MSNLEYPEEFDGLLDEAAEWMEENAFDNALPLLQEAAQLMPGDPEVWQRLGATYLGLGDREEAERSYRRWWEIAPNNPLAFRAYANLLFRMGRYEDAQAAALAWLGQEPDDGYALLLLANARYKRGEEFDSWLERAREVNPDLFVAAMTGVFDYTRGSSPGEWNSLQAADSLGIPETRLIERAAQGGFPAYYDPETETFSFQKDDLDARAKILSRYELENDAGSQSAAVPEVDYAFDADDAQEGEEVRVLLQKCPHCGEWNAGPLGDNERYFCCQTPMDPFVELAGEMEIQGRIARKAGGGRLLSERIRRLTPDEMEELRRLWREEDDWMSRAEEFLERAAEREEER